MADPPSTLTASPSPRSQPPASLTESAGRIDALDILRGLAVLGMIVVHFHQRMRLEVTGPEDLIGWGVWMLIEQKSWGTFAFLFGVGFALFLRGLEARRQPVVPIYLRRLAALAAFGVVAEVVFGFNILFEYACWGLVLLLVRRWPSRALLALALVAVCARPLATWWAGAPVPPPHAALAGAVGTAASGQHYLPLLAARWALFRANVPDTWPELLPDANLALFLVGLLAMRHGVIDAPRAHRRLMLGAMAYGALVWTAWWTVLRPLADEATAGRSALLRGFGFFDDRWLCLTYIGAVLLLLAYRPAWTRRLALFGQAGRMALTNYIAQVAIVDLLASGYGAGLRLRPLLYLPAGVLLFTLLALGSRAWLARFRMGPLEWAWRCVTYARRQPLARTRAG
ncbi:MAG TPA: DUF418 domain-containing protein [Gemmatimonadales bacterium]|jgi:uncharacterized protein|nr:DUF418 domain-containing protein [Gemmatimonadales bacterium]